MIAEIRRTIKSIILTKRNASPDTDSSTKLVRRLATYENLFKLCWPDGLEGQKSTIQSKKTQENSRTPTEIQKGLDSINRYITEKLENMSNDMPGFILSGFRMITLIESHTLGRTVCNKS